MCSEYQGILLQLARNKKYISKGWFRNYFPAIKTKQQNVQENMGKILFFSVLRTIQLSEINNASFHGLRTFIWEKKCHVFEWFDRLKSSIFYMEWPWMSWGRVRFVFVKIDCSNDRDSFEEFLWKAFLSLSLYWPNLWA